MQAAEHDLQQVVRNMRYSFSYQISRMQHKNESSRSGTFLNSASNVISTETKTKLNYIELQSVQNGFDKYFRACIKAKYRTSGGRPGTNT